MKILLTADWHLHYDYQFENHSSDSKTSLLKKIFRKEHSEAVISKMEKIIQQEKISLVIHNGDLMEHYPNEKGLHSKEAFEMTQKMIRQFETRNKVPLLLNMGNHESGYTQESFPLATTAGRITRKSIHNFLKLANRETLYHSQKIDECTIILIPYLFAEKNSADLDLEQEKNTILSKLKQDLQKNERILIFLHDPDSLTDERLAALIHHYRSRIRYIFCGHIHSHLSIIILRFFSHITFFRLFKPFRLMLNRQLSKKFDPSTADRIIAYLQKNRHIFQLYTKHKIVTIPALDGMFGWGSGFWVLDTKNCRLRHSRKFKSAKN
jgi:DNA repair exonuclease SbcCD nuclease subunit